MNPPSFPWFPQENQRRPDKSNRNPYRYRKTRPCRMCLKRQSCYWLRGRNINGWLCTNCGQLCTADDDPVLYAAPETEPLLGHSPRNTYSVIQVNLPDEDADLDEGETR